MKKKKKKCKMSLRTFFPRALQLLKLLKSSDSDLQYKVKLSIKHEITNKAYCSTINWISHLEIGPKIPWKSKVILNKYFYFKGCIPYEFISALVKDRKECICIKFLINFCQIDPVAEG